MRLVYTDKVEAGAILAKSIMNERNQVLLQEGVVLTSRMLERLVNLGITVIHIKDHESSLSKVSDTVTEKLRRKTKMMIQDTFEKLSMQQTAEGGTLVLESSSKEFMDVIRYILNEIKEQDVLLDLISDMFVVDNYIFTHSFNVTLYSIAIGLKMKMPANELEILGLGAILHDIGKLKVPREILMKPGNLTDDEFAIMKKHTEYGFVILKEVKTLPLVVAHCAYQHHERLDGTGYPRGLKDADIQFYAKIIAVADVFDAITSNRVYRDAMLPHEGLEILYAGCGRLFDLKIVEAFRSAVALYPVGVTVELSNRTLGIVKKQNTGVGDRPIIEIIEEDGRRLEESYEINLSKELDIVVVNCVIV